MSTTDILFNSPALHSLKRAQLVQLCKRHNIKASGKNTELVSRLKRHARNLPSGAPLSVAVRSETEAEGGENENDANDGMMTDISDEDNVEEQLSSPVKERESQIWEIVSRGSLDSKMSVATRSQVVGEFGAAANSKSTILKSIASSIGLARSTSSNSIPAGDSSDSLAPPSSNKKDKELSSSPKPRSIFFSLMPRSRANSHESQKGNGNDNNSKEDSRKSLITNAIPYNNIPMPTASRRPQVEPFAFSYAGAEDTSLVSEMSVDTPDRPVPGIGPCSSVNVNNGFGTVRLITNTNKPPQDEEEGPKLTPVVPAFDLIPPTPGKTGLHRFPAPSTPEANRSLYPIISSDDRDVDLETLTSPSKTPGRLGGKGRVDKSLPALPELSPVSPTSPTDPFIFGSPNPRHSTAAEDFSNAASSVLAEMNARLNAGGGRTIDSNVLAAASGQRSKTDIEALMKYEFGGAGEKGKDDDRSKGKKGEGSLSKKFDKLHEMAFSKMEGIDKHYAAKRVLREKEKEKEREKNEKLEPLPDNRKRKQSTLVTRKSTVLTPTKKKQQQQQAAEKESRKKKKGVVIPGAFEQDEMDVDESVVLTDVVIEEHGPERQEQHHEEEENDRGPKRACVEEPIAAGSTETKRVSIVPKVRKDTSNNDEEEEDMDEEKKRKQSEAIKRRLEINKARRRSSRGRVSVASRTPIQKQKSFLASAKSFVKSVWSRSGNASTTAGKTNSSGPSYLRSTASSASKTLEQDAKPISTQTQTQTQTLTHAPARQSSLSRASSVGGGGVARKPSASHQHFAAAAAPKSGLETVAEGKEEKEQAPSSAVTSAPAVQNEKKVQNSQTSGPIFGSVQPRKASATLMRKPSANGTTAPASAATHSISTTAAVASVAGRSSRLLAPTASSLAKAIASPTKSTTTGTTVTTTTLRSKVPSMRVRDSVMSPSKIPVFSPPGKKQKQKQNHGASTPGGKRIFGKPLVLPTSPQARSAAEKGQDINPITGAVSPQRVPFSSANANANVRQTQSLSLAAAANSLALMKEDEGARGKEQGSVERADGGTNNNNQNESPRRINKALNSLRRPRVSRSKVVSKLGGVGSPMRAGSRPVPGSSNANANINATNTVSNVNVNANTGNRPPSTPKVRSSTGIHVRRSLGGASAAGKTREGVLRTPGAVMLSAKKRARTTEYARRKSARGPTRTQTQAQPEEEEESPVRVLDFEKGVDRMEVDA
ncbi:hypothetical protein ACEPAG_2040 [Sanghuangporus baumii]